MYVAFGKRSRLRTVGEYAFYDNWRLDRETVHFLEYAQVPENAFGGLYWRTW